MPALPGVLLSEGKFDKTLDIMLGHNSDEGLLFTDPFVNNQSAYQSIISTLLTAPTAVVDFATTVLYPPVFNGSYGYTTQVERTALTVSEVVFTCNTRYLDLAFGNKTYR